MHLFQNDKKNIYMKEYEENKSYNIHHLVSCKGILGFCRLVSIYYIINKAKTYDIKMITISLIVLLNNIQ
jgi:hypothetical protein